MTHLSVKSRHVPKLLFMSPTEASPGSRTCTEGLDSNLSTQPVSFRYCSSSVTPEETNHAVCQHHLGTGAKVLMQVVLERKTKGVRKCQCKAGISRAQSMRDFFDTLHSIICVIAMANLYCLRLEKIHMVTACLIAYVEDDVYNEFFTMTPSRKIIQ